MTFKKTLTGIALAAGAMVAPMTKAETKPADTPAKTQEAAQGEKITMPAWIPTTADGKFDEKKSHEQFQKLWEKDGQSIQQYADDVAAGVPEEIAFTKFAHKLAKGDKEQEKQILSLYDAVKETRKQRGGNMNVPTSVPWFPFVYAATFGTIVAGVCGVHRLTVGKEASLKPLLWIPLFIASSYASVKLSDKIDPVSCQPVVEKAFVSIQEKMHEAYTKNMQSGYTMTDMATARKMIQMAQGVKKTER